MPDLTDTQLALLAETVEAKEKNGFSLDLGPRHVERAVPGARERIGGHLVADVDTELVESDRHADGRALIRAGMAEWYPHVSPVSRAVMRMAGTPRSPLRRIVHDRQRIVPTARGRVHVAEHLKRSQAAKRAARTRKRRESAA